MTFTPNIDLCVQEEVGVSRFRSTTSLPLGGTLELTCTAGSAVAVHINGVRVESLRPVELRCAWLLSRRRTLRSLRRLTQREVDAILANTAICLQLIEAGRVPIRCGELS